MTRLELKTAAKQQMQGNIGMYFVCMLICAGIPALCAIIPIFGWIADILAGPALSLGLCMVTLGMTYGRSIEVSTVFQGFQKFLDVFLLELLIGIFTFLWSLLFIIPGIIKGISYSMSLYIMAENPDMTAMEAINESKRMMEGHKMDAFVLSLSFIPWILLGSITCGIAYIYVIPYMSTTYANFYHSIKGGNDSYYNGQQNFDNDSFQK